MKSGDNPFKNHELLLIPQENSLGHMHPNFGIKFHRSHSSSMDFRLKLPVLFK